MSDLRQLVDQILIPHSAFGEALNRMGQCINYAKSGAYEPICLAIVGESRTGKTRSSEVFRRRYAAVRNEEGLHVPVMHLLVPSRPTVKALAELALRALGAEDWEKGTENAKTLRLVRLMVECRAHAMFLDEFHHFFDKGSQRVQHHVADWLKNLVGETRVALVVFGLPSLQAVIDQNEQLAGRFVAPVHLPRFDWRDDDHRSEWIAILGAFSEGLAKHFEFPPLDSEGLALRMYCATGGLIGYLSKMLRQAVWDAVEKQVRLITVDDIAAAHRKAVWSNDRCAYLPEPFTKQFLATPMDEMVRQAKKVGAPIASDTPKKTGGAKSASQVLVAR